MKKLILLSLIIITLFACQNQSWEFDDYEGGTIVYFPYQSPMRTICLGDDKVFDITLDNLHKCKIMATMGGAYYAKKEVTINISVDESLCDNLLFKSDNSEVLVMPSNYYNLLSDKIIIPKGEEVGDAMTGGVEVQLTDAFFADPLALGRNYVIPVVMTGVHNADQILTGEAKDGVLSPVRTNSDDWETQPMDYILYSVKYINPWHAYYLRRGKDVINGTETVVRREQYVEKDEVCNMVTLSMDQVEFPLDYKDAAGNDIPVSLILTFNGDDCTISSGNSNATVSGTGKFVENGDYWGTKNRNVLHLNYEVYIDAISTRYETQDTLVVRDRGISMETFEFILN